MLNSVEIHLAQGHPKREAEWHEETEKTRKTTPHHFSYPQLNSVGSLVPPLSQEVLTHGTHTRSKLFRTWEAMAEKVSFETLKMSQDVSSLLDIRMTMCL